MALELMPRAPRYHVVVVALQADVAQQARRAAPGAAARRWPATVDAPAVLGDDGQQLRMDVAPLAHRRSCDRKFCGSSCPQLAVATSCARSPPRILEPVPQLQVAQELRPLVVELLVLLVGGLRPASIGRSRGSCTDSADAMTSTSLSAVALARLEDHAADARVERQLRELAADAASARCRRRPRPVRPAAGSRRRSRARGGGSRNGKSSTVAQAQRLHAQDHAGQRRAQDFRIGECGRPAKSFSSYRRMQMPSATRPQRPRAGWPRPGDRLDLQLLDLVAVAVALDARQAGSIT